MRIFSLLSASCALIVSFSTNTFNTPSPEQSLVPPGMIFELLALNHDLPTAAQPKYLSPCAVVASLDGNYLYVAEQTAKQIAVVDLTSNTVLKNIRLPNEVTGIANGANGLLYATCSSDLWPNGMVCEVSPQQGRVLRRLPAGHGACSPVVSPTENTLFVCNVYDGDVSVIDIGTGNEIKRIEAVREPRCAAITPDGATLVVGNALPNQRSTDTLAVACKITLINAKAREKILDLPLLTGSNSIAGIAISADGNYAFATHGTSMFALPATRAEWMHRNNCVIVDIKKQKILNDVILDNPLDGSADPWGVACSEDGKFLCVVHTGSNQLSVIDMKQLITIADTSFFSYNYLDYPENKRALSNDHSILLDITQKIRIQGKEPRAIAIVGSKAYTAGYFGNNVELFDLGLDSTTISAGTITLGTTVALTSERKGECAFGDAGLCLQTRHSCHTCHSFARTDGMNWTLRGPLVTPKNGKSMLYSWWTPPTNWNGSRVNAHESNYKGLTNELFMVPDSQIVEYLDTFLMKLKPVPSPHLVKGRLSASGLKGKEIYYGSKAACAACHPGPLYTDLKFHNGGIEDRYDASTDWDTPSLVECWRTAPYGHLGSKLTIKEILDLPNMGAVTSKLTSEEINDLVEFVLSL
jgi:YVTN family beta-propeller protein